MTEYTLDEKNVLNSLLDMLDNEYEQLEQGAEKTIDIDPCKYSDNIMDELENEQGSFWKKLIIGRHVNAAPKYDVMFRDFDTTPGQLFIGITLSKPHADYGDDLDAINGVIYKMVKGHRVRVTKKSEIPEIIKAKERADRIMQNRYNTPDNPFNKALDRMGSPAYRRPDPTSYRPESEKMAMLLDMLKDAIDFKGK